MIFQSTPSVGRATRENRRISIYIVFQSTPSVGRATIELDGQLRDKDISIHALRGEGDTGEYRGTLGEIISIHALRGEGDRIFWNQAWYVIGISIHALRGEGDEYASLVGMQNCISIHALRGEGDQSRLSALRRLLLFQSTPSVGRATEAMSNTSPLSKFQSTPSVGRATLDRVSVPLVPQHFNPRPPWGGRQSNGEALPPKNRFQSTPSVGRATI